MALALGIDLGGSKIEIIALDPSGGVLLRRRRDSPRGDYRKTLDAVRALVEEAEAELARLKAEIRSEEDFAAQARTRSEDTATREQGGLLGFVTSGDERVPPEIRAAAHAPDSERESATGPLAGPLRIQSGVVLVWLGELRPAPGWEEMAAHVHNELRKRFMEECLPEQELWIWLDGE